MRFALYAAVLTASAALTATAHATDAAHAWGTVSNPGEVLLNSAATHNQEGQAAQVISQGSGSGVTTTAGGFPAVTSCGTCTTITIQGNQDSISGNSISSINSGTVTSNGFFNQ
ncbi:MAG TPA: hypothetical protein VGL59_16860 [Polyangia bacterium]